jgi:hypothetical protein
MSSAELLLLGFGIAALLIVGVAVGEEILRRRGRRR